LLFRFLKRQHYLQIIELGDMGCLKFMGRSESYADIVP